MIVASEIQRFSQPLVPSTGRMEIHDAGLSVNTRGNSEEAARKVALLNSQEFLEGFFDPEKGKQQILRLRHVGNAGSVATIEPTGRYTPVAKILIAKDKNSYRISADGKTVETQTAYDLLSDVQEAYTEEIVAGLLTMEELMPSDHKVIAARNSMQSITRRDVRFSRTIALDHTHIIAVPSQLKAGTVDFHHLNKERRLLQSVLPDMLQEAMDKLPDDVRKKILVGINLAEPFGYRMQLPKITRANALQNVPYIQDMLNRHHDSYAQAAEACMARIPEQYRGKYKPQPSKREYLHFNDETGQFEAIFVPEIRSHAGVMEALGIALDRQPHHPAHQTPEEAKAFNEKFVAGMEKRLAENNERTVFVA